MKELEQEAWNYYSTNKCIGNAMHTQIGEYEFNGKETITLFDAAEQGRKAFNEKWKKRVDMIHYWKSLER